MAIDPKTARAALDKEFDGLTAKSFGERLHRATPSWATPTKKTKRPKKKVVAKSGLVARRSKKAAGKKDSEI